MNYEMKNSKTIVNKLKNIDNWFWCRYTLNPYTGCEHACVYCDARSDRYYLHEDFEETIYYKENASELLKKKIINLRSDLPDVIAFGGSCDEYQPAEKKVKITQKILKVIERHGWPVSLSTKNDLIIRDLPIFEEIAKKSYATVSVSLSTVDPKISLCTSIPRNSKSTSSAKSLSPNWI